MLWWLYYDRNMPADMEYAIRTFNSLDALQDWLKQDANAASTSDRVLSVTYSPQDGYVVLIERPKSRVYAPAQRQTIEPEPRREGFGYKFKDSDEDGNPFFDERLGTKRSKDK